MPVVTGLSFDMSISGPETHPGAFLDLWLVRRVAYPTWAKVAFESERRLGEIHRNWETQCTGTSTIAVYYIVCPSKHMQFYATHLLCPEH